MVSNKKQFPSDEDAAEYLAKWREQPRDYAVEPGDSIPMVHKSNWLDRLWNWVKRP